MTQPTNPAFDGGTRQRVPRRWTILFGARHPGGAVSVNALYLTPHTVVSANTPLTDNALGAFEQNMCTRPSGQPQSRIGGPENNSYQIFIEKMRVTQSVAQAATRDLTVQLMVEGAPVGTAVVLAGGVVGAVDGNALQTLIATAVQRIGVTAQATGAGAAALVATNVQVELDVFER